MPSRVEKLAAKGMIAFEVDGVLGRLTKKQSAADVDLRRDLSKFIRGGAILGATIKRRMRDRKTFADGTPWEPSSALKPFRVSRKYAKPAGFVDRIKKRKRMLIRYKGASKATYRRRPDVGFRSTAAMYEASKTKGAFSVTDGMWGGLTARTWGALGVRILFDSTSQGRGKPKDFGKTLRGEPVIFKASQSVENWRKGGLTFLATRKNILELSDAEVLSVGSAVAITSLRAVTEQIGKGGKVPVVNIQFEGDKSLARELTALLEK